MDRPEFTRLKRELKERYKDDLQALRRVFELSMRLKGRTEDADSGDSDAEVDEDDEPSTSLVEAVKAVVTGEAGEFGSKAVLRQLRAKFPELEGTSRASVASTLKRLSRSGFVDVITEGKGKTPSIYRVVAKGGG
jgi:hypothetical protein